jgi:hypothetical protein
MTYGILRRTARPTNMIARISFTGATPSPARPRWALAWLMAAHVAADIAIAHVTIASLGLEAFGVVGPFALGFVWGQAALLGQFLLLGSRRPVLRSLLVATWVGLVFYLGEPAFRAMGAPSGVFGGCFFIGVPLFCSAIVSMLPRQRGQRIVLSDGRGRADRDAFQFSLRQLFKLISWAAIVLAAMRLTAQAFEDSAWLILFGVAPLTNALVLQVWLSPVVVLGGEHPAWGSAGLLSLAVVSALVPLVLCQAGASIYWGIACPVVVQSLVVLGSLWIARAVGYRSEVIAALAFRPCIRPAHEIRPR